tara:strand:+ start:3651 stop:3875 length:225 start_codon:yes stop_codon:yes gene_type:complete
MQDPDQLSTRAYDAMKNVRRDRPTGLYVVSDNEDDLKELQSEGLVDQVDSNGQNFEAVLNGDGRMMLKAMGEDA